MSNHWVDHMDDGFFLFHCDKKDTKQGETEGEKFNCKGCGKEFIVTSKVIIKEIK